MPTLGPPACTSSTYGAAAGYSPKQTLEGSLTNSVTATTVTASGSAVQRGDMILINSEKMFVTDVNGSTLTVERAQSGSALASHNDGTEIKTTARRSRSFRSRGSSERRRRLRRAASGSRMLQPGTYYGGICIGATSGTSCDGNCDTGTANVTLAPGTYVMAGGGFHVCGSSTVSAPMALVKTANGLDGLSGTIYAPNDHALFGDSASGTANLAVITGCIFIDGADSTFDFEGSGLFGVGTSLAE